MIKDQCVSVTDLRTKTKECLEGLDVNAKYIFMNNKPIAVLVDVDEYEEMFTTDLIEMPEDELTPELIAMAEEARNTPKDELLNI